MLARTGLITIVFKMNITIMSLYWTRKKNIIRAGDVGLKVISIVTWGKCLLFRDFFFLEWKRLRR